MAKLIYEKDARGATLVNGKIYRIPATKDYIFKNLFGINGKEENLKGLLQAILKIKIESLQIENPEIPPQYKEDKKGILDVRAKLSDGTTVFIEMQVNNEHNIGERITFYLCRVYSNTIKSGGLYNKIEKTIAIVLINFSYFNRKEYHQIAHLKFEECRDKDEIVDDIEDIESKVVTVKLELHIIDLKKFNKINHPKGELADWLNLIIGNEEEIEMCAKRNKVIKRVNEENKKLSVDKDMQEQYWYEEKTLYARNTEISVAEEEGKKQKQLEIAKKMKDRNKTMEEIIELTELSKEEIEKL